VTVSVYIPDELRARILEADGNRCAYCQTSEVNSGIPLSIDHIQPQSEGGETVALFNPRTQRWKDHFEWGADGARMYGLIATGRATVIALQVNRPVVVAARSRWVSGGWHPPID
jgi:hypothetical protein